MLRTGMHNERRIFDSVHRNQFGRKERTDGEKRMSVQKPRVSFAAEVSTSELLYFREKEQLSNREIAKRLGVSYASVLERIGPQPRRAKDQQPEETL